jgi:hypothetical protein
MKFWFDFLLTQCMMELMLIMIFLQNLGFFDGEMIGRKLAFYETEIFLEILF